MADPGRRPDAGADGLVDLPPALRELLSAGAHDLKTPLVSLRGFLELMAMRAEALPEPMRAWVESMGRSAQSLQNGIEDLLLAVRAGADLARREPAPLVPLLETETGMLRARAARLNVDLDMELPPADLCSRWRPSLPAALLRIPVDLLLEHGYPAGQGGLVRGRWRGNPTGHRLELAWTGYDPGRPAPLQLLREDSGFAAQVFRLLLLRSEATLQGIQSGLLLELPEPAVPPLADT